MGSLHKIRCGDVEIMGKPTPKMCNFILKQNWATLEEVEQMSYEQASALISSKLEKKGQPASYAPKPSYSLEKPVTSSSVPLQASRDTMMMISYAKDLFVGSNGERTWEACIQMVKDAKSSFEK